VHETKQESMHGYRFIEHLTLSMHGQIEGMDVDQRVEWMRENSKETYDEAKSCITTNYYGAKLVTEALLPLLLLSSSGRIVNVSSGFGLLRVSYKLCCSYTGQVTN
jgi:short-subunit dehydrogenase involved in D-alanine esterification of teichoic acids